ncbi:MAG: pyridoxamine 5'-phosphate oxidase family protein [Marinovum sp.]|nr:pyridoxamine 5'-phosphate oxidase family protein [Marinovum sp.]
MSDPGDLAVFWDDAWQRLRRGVVDRRAAARTISFATVSPTGWPEVRTVVLRAADISNAMLEVHSDSETAKVAALKTTPRAALHVWDPKADLQIRASGEVRLLSGPKVAAQWAQVPDVARVSYGTDPAPGTPIESVYSYEKPANPDRFVVLQCHLTEVDLVHLGERHRRARYVRADGWQGIWCAP